MKTAPCIDKILSTTLVVLLVLTSTSAFGANPVWDGGGADNSWSTAANWNPNTAPVSGADSLFFGGSTRLANTNDFVGFTALNLQFANNGGDFVLSGNSLAINSNLSSQNTVASSLPTVNLNLTSLGGLYAQQAGSLLMNGNISSGTALSAGSTLATGTGKVILAGTNTFTTLTVSSGGVGTGHVQIGNGGTTGTLGSGAVTISTNATLTFNRSNSYTVANAMSGAGTVVLDGPGTVDYSTAKAYTGNTIVNAGTLLVNNTIGSGLGSGAVTINNSGVLGGTGSFSGAATLNSGGAMSPGVAGIESLGGSSLVWNGGGSMLWDLSNVSTSADLLSLTGALTKGSAGTFSFDFGGTGGMFTYNLITFASTTFSVSDFSYTNLGSGLSGSFSVTGNALNFTVVPEPSSVTLVLLGATAFFFLAKRRRPAGN